MFSFFFLFKSLIFFIFFEFYVNYFFILAIFRGWVDVFWGFGWNVGWYWIGKVLDGWSRTYIYISLFDFIVLLTYLYPVRVYNSFTTKQIHLKERDRES